MEEVLHILFMRLGLAVPKPNKATATKNKITHLKNIHAKVNKIFANQIQEYIKIIHHSFIPDMLAWFITFKSINVIKRLRKHMIISMNAEKASDKNPTFFQDKKP